MSDGNLFEKNRIYYAIIYRLPYLESQEDFWNESMLINLE